MSTRVQQLSVVVDSKTKDDVTVQVAVALQYRVINEFLPAPQAQRMQRNGDSKPLRVGESAPLTGSNSLAQPMYGTETAPIENHGAWRAYYTLTGVRTQFNAYIEDVVRSEIPTRTLDQVYRATPKKPAQ
jgi:regulator of protease activity HflC (stomatin/prohibitin superfamily)